jgi:hypothetical protein
LVVGGVPPISIAEVVDQVQNRDALFFQGDVIVQDGGRSYSPGFGRETEVAYSLVVERIERLLSGWRNAHPHVATPNHVEVNAPERFGGIG